MVGYSPWGCKESDTIEHTHTHILKPEFYTVKNILFSNGGKIKSLVGKENLSESHLTSLMSRTML